MISDKKAVQDLVILMWEKGIRHVVISPGSRNAPLTISFNNYEQFKCYSIIDERSAGYFALGMAQQLNQAVAIVCTSGTAALNYGPAVAEAFYQKIPLLVITTDRPKEFIDQGEGQSIRQENIYSQHTRKSVNLVLDNDEAITEDYNARLINEAINSTFQNPRGPAHINIPLAENLYGVIEFPKSFPKKIDLVDIQKQLSPDVISDFVQKAESSKKILVICGMMKPDRELQNLLKIISQKNQFLVLSESTSNLKDSNIISSIDRLIMTFDDDDQKTFAPEILITLGDNIVSKKIKYLLRENQISEHWQIGEFAIQDTFNHLTHHLELDPKVLFNPIADIQSNDSDYKKIWSKRNEVNISNMNDFVADLEFCDLKAFEIILSSLPEEINFQMGNSSVIRYIQLFENNDNTLYYSNRGTSGIDGCTSTAVGASVISEKPVYLVTGDIAFFYDSNGLWNDYLSKNLKIILINNGGGGIFRIIDGPSKTGELEGFFETKHSKNAKDLCHMNEVNYLTAHNAEELSKQLSELHQSSSCAVLEVFTPAEKNDQLLKSYFRYLIQHKNIVV